MIELSLEFDHACGQGFFANFCVNIEEHVVIRTIFLEVAILDSTGNISISNSFAKGLRNFTES